MSMKKKRIVKIVMIAVAIFAAYNIFWFSVTHIKYNKYVNNITGIEREYIGSYGKFYSKEDPHNYTVKLPGYLSYEGSLNVNNNEDVSVFVWPSVFSDSTSYGLTIGDNSEDTVSINVDSSGSIAEDSGYSELEKQHYQKLIDAHKEEIKELFDIVKERWNT